MKVTGMTTGANGSHSDRNGTKRQTWGDCGAARTSTPEYEAGMERIFGKKKKKKVELTPEELAFLERKKERNKNRPIYPY